MRENSPYMADYVLDAQGAIEQVRFDKVTRHLKICVQVSLFFAVGIFIQKLPPETYGSHHCDQYQ
mgnify:CR=1 FL=1